jgi:hypothetical protein
VKKLFLISGAALVMAACAEAPTAPSPTSKAQAGGAARADVALECRSGYIIAYDQDGNPYCAPAQETQQSSAGSASFQP